MFCSPRCLVGWLVGTLGYGTLLSRVQLGGRRACVRSWLRRLACDRGLSETIAPRLLLRATVGE